MPRGRKKNVNIGDTTGPYQGGDQTPAALVVTKSWLVTMVFDDVGHESRYSVQAYTKRDADNLRVRIAQSGFTVEDPTLDLSVTYPAHRLIKVEVRGPDAA